MSVLEKENSMFMIFMTAVMLILTAVIAWQFKTNLYVFLTKKNLTTSIGTTNYDR
jgi:hypothetical protein